MDFKTRKVLNLKKNHFFFGRKNKRKRPVAKVFIKRSHSNIFITLTDLKNSVIICHSSGSSLPSPKKRKDKIYKSAIQPIVVKIKKYLIFHKIKYLKVIINSKIRSQIYALVHELRANKFFIIKLFNRRRNPHNGVKLSKLSRK